MSLLDSNIQEIIGKEPIHNLQNTYTR